MDFAQGKNGERLIKDHSHMNNTSTYFSPFWSVMKICMRHRAGRVGKWLFKSPCCEAKSAVSLRDWNTAFLVWRHTAHTHCSYLMFIICCGVKMHGVERSV